MEAEVCYLPGVSGHADKNGLINWLSGFENKPKRVFVNHGDDESCTDFTNALNEMGYTAYAPYSGCVYSLFEDKIEIETQGIPITEKASGREKKSRKLYNELVFTAHDVLSFVKACDGRANKEISQMTRALKDFMKKFK